MKLDRISMIFWALFATAAGGAFSGLLMIQDPAMNSLYMRLSDVQTCIETYGTLTCGIHHVIGGRGFAMFAAGALVSVFCALPTVLRFALQFSRASKIRVGFSVGVGICMGVIVYVALKWLGIVGGFLFDDVIVMGLLGWLASFYAWLACTSCARVQSSSPSKGAPEAASARR